MWNVTEVRALLCIGRLTCMHQVIILDRNWNLCYYFSTVTCIIRDVNDWRVNRVQTLVFAYSNKKWKSSHIISDSATLKVGKGERLTEYSFNVFFFEIEGKVLYYGENWGFNRIRIHILAVINMQSCDLNHWATDVCIYN